jgi:hypothetical protein
MQKKLVLLSILSVLSCVKINASENATVNQEKYAEYCRERYHAALIKALSDDEEAIDQEDQKSMQENDQEAKVSEQANKQEEENKRRKYYDGEPGYWASQATDKSKVGLKFAKYAEERKLKDKVNIEDKKSRDKIYQQYSKEAKNKRNIFNTKILPQFKHELEADRFFIFNYCLPALKECGMNLDCYEEKGLSSKIFTNSEFVIQREAMFYKRMATFSAVNGINFTPEQMKLIAQNNSVIKGYFAGIQNGKTEFAVSRDEILNPKKNTEEIRDIKEDQNDQGALSQ